ncbi:MFS transporter [Inhella gelatinilytica]|uniref:MFS transporter n=1 Tax=Inhella gelatinilytica TaxID=2795030 RepID=A0A931IZ55_9BURK|nr:MFS transporter [Inhella gelatinilytica]MBH9554276.1 MFS transporter [Inhella gelatinilytica]
MQPPHIRPSAVQILACGAAIVTLSMGIRHGFGLWLQPIITERGWTREDFALALAVQNLVWGAIGPLTGMWADRVGAFRPLVAGALLYAIGLMGMAAASAPWAFVAATGLVIGAAQSGTTYAVIYGVIGRQLDPTRRSWAMGVVASAGSFGQFLMLPVEHQLIERFGWQPSLWLLAGTVLAIVPLAWGLREPSHRPQTAGRSGSGSGAALLEALRTPSYLWLTAGYFVCGFQVVFIGVHLPAFLKDQGLPAQVGTYALALIGLFNVVGTYAAGQLGQKWPRRYILAFIYSARSVAIVAYLGTPISAPSTYVFASVMGLLWLSTIPPTNATVAQIFGVSHLSMLAGLVFFSHQIGSFLGVWLGGYVFDQTGSYDWVWWSAVALGVAAALANLPVREQPLVRPHLA